MTELIVALDTNDFQQAQDLVAELGPAVGFYKVGLELYTSAGPEVIRWLKGQEKKVFLDLKFHDIPNTAGRAVAVAAAMGVELCTVHAAGGAEMLAACNRQKGNTRLLAVSVLTSLGQRELEHIGIRRPLAEQVQATASLAWEAGIDGVICAPTDLKHLAGFPANMLRVTPGIRPEGSAVADQRRVMTPAEAARGGASHIVVGRPITEAARPAAAAAAIIRQLEASG